MLWKTVSFESPLSGQEIGPVIQAFAEEKNLFPQSENANSSWTLKSSPIPGTKSFFDIQVKTVPMPSGSAVQLTFSPKLWVLIILGISIPITVYFVGKAVTLFFLNGFAGIGGLSKEGAYLLEYSLPVSILLGYLYGLARSKTLVDLKGQLIPGFLDTAAGRKDMYRSFNSVVSSFTNIYYFFVLIGMGFIFLAAILVAFGVLDNVNHPSDLWKKLFP